VVAGAQQDGRMRRVAVLMVGDENDPLVKTFVSAFIQALGGLGWTDGRNVRIDVRRFRGDETAPDRMRAFAQCSHQAFFSPTNDLTLEAATRMPSSAGFAKASQNTHVHVRCAEYSKTQHTA
jgi:hypothetical protein